MGLKLPSERILYDYRNCIQQAVGIQHEHVQILVDLLKRENNPAAFWCGIQFDEVQIRAGLVFNKRSGKLVGFVDLDDVDVDLFIEDNISTGDDNTQKRNNENLELANHILQFCVMSMGSSIFFPVAYYATRNLKANQV